MVIVGAVGSRRARSIMKTIMIMNMTSQSGKRLMQCHRLHVDKSGEGQGDIEKAELTREVIVKEDLTKATQSKIRTTDIVAGS